MKGFVFVLACAAALPASAATQTILMNRLGPSEMVLYVANADGSGERKLFPTSGFYYHASFSADEKWIVTPVNNGFRITSAASRLAVDATSPTPNPGTNIVQAKPTGETNQLWVIR